MDMITAWQEAQTNRNMRTSQQQPQSTPVWTKPNAGRFKCNIDASFSTNHNKVGIGMCIRDDQGRFVLAKTEWLTPIHDVDLGEALGLLHAINWVHELELENVDFELDSKNVVTKFHSNKEDMSELGDVIRDCQRLHNSFFTNSRVEFIRRQANEVAHALARVATSLASFHIFIEIPTCIQHIIINEML
jgi:ribonuclease HI